jgi:hypothetical protein
MAKRCPTTMTRATAEAIEGKSCALSDMHAAMQGHALSPSILPSWQGNAALSVSARTEIWYGLNSIPDIVTALAASTRGYSGETMSPTIKSTRNMIDVLVTLTFWHI